MINRLQPNDLPLIVAWKIGAINHQDSEREQDIVYENQFGQNLQLRAHYGTINAVPIINYCENNFNELLLTDNAEEKLNLLYDNRGEGCRFGRVYCHALEYFFTQGEWPIYDKYADVALDSIISDKPTNSRVEYRAINNWTEYIHFVDKVRQVFGTRSISRNIDRVLWVYGHFFDIITM